MRLLPTSAAYRIALVSAVAFALATFVLGVLVLYAAHVTFTGQLEGSIAEASSSLVAEYRAEGRGGLDEGIRRREARSGDDLGYAVFAPDARQTGGRMQTPRPTLGWSDIVFQDPITGPDPARALAVDLPNGERLVVAADLEPLDRIDATILSIFAGALLIVLLLSGAGALVLGAYLRRRLARITHTADAVVAGDLSRRVPIGTAGDEFDRVGASLNLMLERVAALVANLRQVSSDVAHDLRTPLSRLRAQLERAQTFERSPIVRREAVEAAMRNCEQVLTIFEAILRISEVEAGGARSRFADVDLSALANEVVEAVAPAAEDEGRSIRVSSDSACVVTGDHQLIAQALVNLIENALRHTPRGTRVVVGTTCGPDFVRLFVADDGPGVPDCDKLRILKRFVRLEASRSTPGHGLGLSLVAAVADLHRARLGVEDNHPGLRVSLEFERSSAP